MAWFFICIAVGAAGFLIKIIIDYLNDFSALKPRAEMARLEIRECEMQIEIEQSESATIMVEVDELKKEVGELEIQLTDLSKKLEEYRDRERRRKPTNFKLED